MALDYLSVPPEFTFVNYIIQLKQEAPTRYTWIPTHGLLRLMPQLPRFYNRLVLRR